MDLVQGLPRCSRCGGPNDRTPQRYCLECHAAWMRERRPKHSKLNPIAKRKANARSYANAYKNLGLLVPRISGDDVQMHHPDYNLPLEVKWLTRDEHLALHRNGADVSRPPDLVRSPLDEALHRQMRQSLRRVAAARDELLADQLVIEPAEVE